MGLNGLNGRVHGARIRGFARGALLLPVGLALSACAGPDAMMALAPQSGPLPAAGAVRLASVDAGSAEASARFAKALEERAGAQGYRLNSDAETLPKLVAYLAPVAPASRGLGKEASTPSGSAYAYVVELWPDAETRLLRVEGSEVLPRAGITPDKLVPDEFEALADEALGRLAQEWRKIAAR
jgi:hypothetical protein